jgi:hypothetical protein
MRIGYYYYKISVEIIHRYLMNITSSVPPQPPLVEKRIEEDFDLLGRQAEIEREVRDPQVQMQNKDDIDKCRDPQVQMQNKDDIDKCRKEDRHSEALEEEHGLSVPTINSSAALASADPISVIASAPVSPIANAWSRPGQSFSAVLLAAKQKPAPSPQLANKEHAITASASVPVSSLAAAVVALAVSQHRFCFCFPLQEQQKSIEPL